MSNLPRPKCPTCVRAMEPLFAKRLRGRSTMRVPGAYWCRKCSTLAQGRKAPRFLRPTTPRSTAQRKLDDPLPGGEVATAAEVG